MFSELFSSSLDLSNHSQLRRFRLRDRCDLEDVFERLDRNLILPLCISALSTIQPSCRLEEVFIRFGGYDTAITPLQEYWLELLGVLGRPQFSSLKRVEVESPPDFRPSDYNDLVVGLKPLINRGILWFDGRLVEAMS
jgi:hypothetical protein